MAISAASASGAAPPNTSECIAEDRRVPSPTRWPDRGNWWSGSSEPSPTILTPTPSSSPRARRAVLGDPAAEPPGGGRGQLDRYPLAASRRRSSRQVGGGSGTPLSTACVGRTGSTPPGPGDTSSAGTEAGAVATYASRLP